MRNYWATRNQLRSKTEFVIKDKVELQLRIQLNRKTKSE